MVFGNSGKVSLVGFVVVVVSFKFMMDLDEVIYDNWLFLIII